MSITASAVLVDLNMSIWTARKLDKRVSDEINVSKNTTANAGNYSKNLLAGSNSLSDISKFAAKIRQWHNQQTLPWSDSGTRMLPMANFMDYKAGLKVREDTLRNMIVKFLAEYPNLVNDAANKLGALFDATEYPDVAEVEKKFRLTCVFAPVPEAGDFRVDAESQIKEELREQYAKEADSRLNGAMKEAWNRLHEVLSHISERMEDAKNEEGEGVKKKFRESLIDNPTELCSLLTKLNVTKDPKLEEARQDLERALSGVTIADLRDSEGERQAMKERVDNILKKFQW